MTESFNARLVKLMSQGNITVREAASVAQVAPSTIQNWRSGGRPSGDFEHVQMLARRLGVSLCYLLTGTEDISPPYNNPQSDRALLGVGAWSGIYEISIKEISLTNEVSKRGPRRRKLKDTICFPRSHWLIPHPRQKNGYGRCF